MSSDDYGKDLAGVQALQRRQDDVERDMTALHSQLGVSGALKQRFNYSQISKFEISNSVQFTGKYSALF